MLNAGLPETLSGRSHLYRPILADALSPVPGWKRGRQDAVMSAIGRFRVGDVATFGGDVVPTTAAAAGIA